MPSLSPIPAIGVHVPGSTEGSLRVVGDGGTLDEADSLPLSLVDGLSDALDSKADAATLAAHVGSTSNPHGVTAAQVGAYTTSQVDTALAGKAASSHGHAIADVTSLQSALDDKATASALATHTASTANPHSTTASQVGAPALAPATTSANTIQPSSGAACPLTVKGHASQTAELMRAADSTDATRFSVGPTGQVLFKVGTAGPTAVLPSMPFTLASDVGYVVMVNTATPSAGSGMGIVGQVWGRPTAADQRLGFMLLGSADAGSGALNACGFVAYTSASWSGANAGDAATFPAYLTFETTGTDPGPSGAGSGPRKVRATFDEAGNVVCGGPAGTSLATSATAGFFWLPGGAGAPTGTPSKSYTGRFPAYVDSSNNRIYVRIGSTWRYAALT